MDVINVKMIVICSVLNVFEEFAEIVLKDGIWMKTILANINVMII